MRIGEKTGKRAKTDWIGDFGTCGDVRKTAESVSLVPTGTFLGVECPQVGCPGCPRARPVNARCSPLPPPLWTTPESMWHGNNRPPSSRQKRRISRLPLGSWPDTPTIKKKKQEKIVILQQKMDTLVYEYTRKVTWIFSHMRATAYARSSPSTCSTLQDERMKRITFL